MDNQRVRQLLKQALLTTRQRRDFDARFTRDMRALRQRVPKRHDGESQDELLERIEPVFQQFEKILERYQSLFTLWRPQRQGHGGRPTNLLRDPTGASGRPQDRLAARVDAIATRTGRAIPDVARDVHVDVMRSRAPARYRRLAQRVADLTRDYTPERALREAFKELPNDDVEKHALRNLIHRSYDHRQRRR